MKTYEQYIIIALRLFLSNKEERRKSMEDLKLVGVRLPKKMYEEAEEAATKKGQTMSAFIRLALAEYLEQEAQKKAKSETP